MTPTTAACMTCPTVLAWLTGAPTDAVRTLPDAERQHVDVRIVLVPHHFHGVATADALLQSLRYLPHGGKCYSTG